jgi:6-phosphofructokinase
MPALASDRVFCNIIGASAVHAAFGGLMNCMVAVVKLVGKLVVKLAT